MKKFLSCIFLLLFFASFSVFAQTSQCEKMTIDGKLFYFYKAGSRETLADVSRRFGVSEEDILANNYLVAQRGMRRFETLKIPVNDSIDNPCGKIMEPAQAEEQPAQTGKKTLKVAYFMPFALNGRGSGAANDRFMEFYQGALLAIRQLKNEGVSFEIYAYDTGTDALQLDNILAKPEIREMDIFIGPVYTSQIKKISTYSKALGIRHVVPFSAQTTETAINPMLFQYNLAPAQQAEVAARRFVSNFGTQPIVIVEFNNAASADTGTAPSEKTKEFITVLKRELQSARIAYQSLRFDGGNYAAIAAALASEGENILVPGSSDPAILTGIISLLKTTGKDFALFGTPDWLSANGGMQEGLFTCKLYLYTPFYTDNTNLDVQLFRHDFNNVFGSYNQSSLPFFNFYGYDVSLYFLSALARYGKDFEKNLSSHSVKTLQSHFDFERINATGGFVNNGLWLLQYTPKKPVLKRPF